MGKGPSVPSNTLGDQGNLTKAFGGLANTWSNMGAANAAAAGGPINAAQNYYSQLLAGGRGAQNVTAPMAMQISDVYGGQKRNLQQNLPAGGERNLALANLGTSKARSIADLYANVQPQAAQSLASLGLNIGQLGTGYGSLGANFGSNANQGYNTLIGYQGQRNQAKGSALGGIGQGLGTLGGAWLLG